MYYFNTYHKTKNNEKIKIKNIHDLDRIVSENVYSLSACNHTLYNNEARRNSHRKKNEDNLKKQGKGHITQQLKVSYKQCNVVLVI